MGAVILGEPLGRPMQYDPSFKVEPVLSDPLWVRPHSAPGGPDVMAICAQLELLCRKEVAQRTQDQAHQGVLSRSFETKGLMLRDKLRLLLKSPSNPQPNILEYLQRSSLDRLYPRTVGYLTNPERPTLTADPETDVDGYFEHMSRLNQVVAIAAQISADVANPHNHKYLSHQLALLHQALTTFKDHKPVARLKKNIEANFETLKTALVRGEKLEPRLTEEQGQWLLDLTSAVVSTVSSLPAGLAQGIVLPAYILTQLPASYH